MSPLQASLPTLGFLGAGNMASALLRGTVGRGALAPETVWACDIAAEKLSTLTTELGIHVSSSPLELLDAVRTVVLAVKPQDLPPLLDSVSDSVRPHHLLISIAAGLPLAAIASHLPPTIRLIRVMPNTPALIGEGAAGVAPGEHATEEDLRTALALFSAVGLALPCQEADLDAVTALSGSGPAYVFRIIEIMEAAAQTMGLPADIARRLTLQTVLGAAQLASQSEESPAELRRRVTSPAGTTAAALEVFEREGLAEAFTAGILRARERSIELAQAHK